MSPRLHWRRRSATAVGLYASFGLGILGTIVAARVLGLTGFGRYATVFAAASFFQALLDLTVEESLTKYGFRYVTSEDWGRLHRLFRRALELKLVGGLLATLALLALAPFADQIFGTSGLAAPLVAISALPFVQAPENVATTAILLRGRYDLRGWLQAFSMALRFTAIAVGVQFGVTQTMAAIVLVQILATFAVGAVGWKAFHRFPAAAPIPLGDDRREVAAFIAQSSLATGMVSLRSSLAPLVLGAVSNATEVGLLRVAQAPQTGLNALSSPVRLIQLTEQTRDWEQGDRQGVLRGVRSYMRAGIVLAVVLIPVFYVLMPWLVRVVFGSEFLGAVTAARIVLVAATLQLVFSWTKSFPVSIGRPHLRIVTHGVETLVLLPLTALLGAEWGVSGAAAAILVSVVAFCALWAVLLIRIHADERTGRQGAGEALVP